MSRAADYWPERTEPAVRVVFCLLLAGILMALRWPEMPPMLLQAILWCGLGVAMIVVPPQQPGPKALPWLALGFVVFGAAGFLPAAVFGVPEWRSKLETVGIPTGDQAYIHVRSAAENLVGFAVTAAFAVYFSRQRVGANTARALQIAFALGVMGIAWWAVAVAVHRPGGVFGFFPNRNHTACLLAVGVVAAWGAALQGIRERSPWTIGLSLVAVGGLLYPLLMHSVSRAGLLLAGVGLTVYLVAAGRRSLGGHAGKAVLLAYGTAVALFFILDIRAKERLADTLEIAQTWSQAEPTLAVDETPAGTGLVEEPPMPIDSRAWIFQDTVTMIKSAPWTGIGPGQFLHVFFQFRDEAIDPANAIHHHPENDWLWMAAECGVPAALMVAGFVLVSAWHGWRALGGGRARAMRAGAMVAAMLVPLHGWVDVPGHRMGLAWAAIWLFALALRPANPLEMLDKEENIRGRTFGPWGWRILGLAVLAAGSWKAAAVAGWLPATVQEQVVGLKAEIKKHRIADQVWVKKRLADPSVPLPPPDADPLDLAWPLVEEALALLPLDRDLYFSRGVIAVNFEDLKEQAPAAFAAERALNPVKVDLPLIQSMAFVHSDLEETARLWDDAMKRAARVTAKRPRTQWNPIWCARSILRIVGKDQRLIEVARKVSENHPELAEALAQRFPPKPAAKSAGP